MPELSRRRHPACADLWTGVRLWTTASPGGPPVPYTSDGDPGHRVDFARPGTRAGSSRSPGSSAPRSLVARRIAGAFLDPTDPEPLPADHPLWSAPNALITMHLSGRSQTKMFQRAGALFLKNLKAFMAGEAMTNVVDLDLGY